MIETDFTRVGRPEPISNIVQQDKYGCSPAALSMLLGESYFRVKRAYAKFQWRNDNDGATDAMMLGAARMFGRDLVYVPQHAITKEVGPCIVVVKSLNYENGAHAVVWNGSELLDPNWGYAGRKWWGVEWSPWTIGAYCVWELLDCELSEEERKEQDAWVKNERNYQRKLTKDLHSWNQIKSFAFD